MMSLIDLDEDQRWVPTHVNVTVLRARGLRTKSKHGSRYLYTIIQVGKEKYTTGLVEKAEMPEWNEECCFELLPGILEEESSRSAHPPAGSGLLVLTVMHRVLIGLDVFLGQSVIPLQKIFQDGMCPRDEWFKLNSKAGRKEKERGELQVTVQFTRNNMTASMFDLTMKDKPRSTFGKLKDRVTGRKRGDMESSSAIVPGRYAALSGSLGQPFGGAAEATDAETAEEKKSKVKDFFKGRLSKSSDTRSCSSLASDSSIFSIGSDNPAPPPSLDLMSDPPSSPIYTSKVRVDPQYGDTAFAKKVLTSQHTTKVLTHKRAFSDETRRVTTGFPRPNPAVESLKGQTMTQSKSSVCINGSHVYGFEPSSPKSSAAQASKMDLLEKCSPLSRSLQNLTKRGEDKGSFSENRHWSLEKKKEEKEEEREAQTSSTTGGQPVQAVVPDVSTTAGSSDKGKKLRKTLFSGGRSESLPAKSDQNQGSSASEGRLRGWFGSSDSQHKPRLEVSPKVESSSDVPPPLPQCSSPTAPPSGHVSPDDCNHTNPFTPSPSSTSISLSNPSPSRTQRNPFLDDLVAEDSQGSPPFTPPSFHYTTLPSQQRSPGQVHDVTDARKTYMRRERPRPVPRQTSLPAVLPKETSPEEWDESFDVFASSRLGSPKGSLSQKQLVNTPISSCSYVTANSNNNPQEQNTCEEKPPPLPPRRLLRNSVNEIYSDGWLHRGQELAVHKEAYLLSQTGVASRQRGREGESKRNSISPDPNTNSEASDPQQSTILTSQGSGEKLKRSKYEPLEDERSCWGGMLFEQDLYGRVSRGNYGQLSLNSRHLSVTAEEMSRSKMESMNSGAKMVPDSETPLAELRNMLPTPPSKLHEKVPDTPTTPLEETESRQTENINNNVSFSLTTGDLNMNVNNSDLDASSKPEVVHAPKRTNSFGGSFPKTLENSLLATYHVITHQNLPPLKDTYIREGNSSFEITAPSNKRCKVPSACRENCQDCRCVLTNFVPQGHSMVEGKLNTTSDPPGLESIADLTNPDVSKKAGKDFDDNGNPQDQRGNRTEPYGGVVSARFRPKGVSRQSSNGSLNHPNKSGDREFEQLLSLVRNISGDSEGPFSYQPTKSAASGSLVVNKPVDYQGDNTNQDTTHESDTTAQMLSNENTAFPVKENAPSGKSFEISFEDLHAKVAPNSSKLEPPSPSDEEHGTPHDKPLSRPSMHPSSLGPSASSSSTSSYHSTTSTLDQPPVDARHSLLPEETHPASNLPQPESRPHPVKPLNSSQQERKESRSVLEKLKSTIHPGRSTQQVAGEPERSQEVAVDRSAQYQNLTNMELISLLLQQEMDMQKQQAASRQQEAKLQKCEAELKKIKLQVGDLEDYIDNLLLRIMEQTPTLLQVRTRHK